MKSYLIILITVLFAATMTSCNKGKIEELERKNQALSQSNQLQDSLLNDFMSSFNQFEDNLEMIKEKEELIAVNSEDPEFRKNGKEKVLEDLTMINNLLDQNRSIIAELNEKLAGSEGKLKEFRRMVSRLKGQLEEKDAEVATLNEQLTDMSFAVETMGRKIDTLHRTTENLTTIKEMQTARLTLQADSIDQQLADIEAKTEQLNTAYYIAGTAKELREKNIISNEGGFIGIGASKKLNSDIDPSAFTRIDITAVNEIQVDTKKAKVITNHPSDSYVLNQEAKKIESLEITNPDRFWKSSKYLVVVLN